MIEDKKISRIKSCDKKGKPLVCLTAYTTPIAKILDQYCDLLLVGDSVGTVFYGMENTLDVTLDMMINHGKAVTRGAKSACIVVDMPYGTYEHDPKVALTNAQRIIKETGCDAVKLEGGQDMADTISYLVKNNIPVMGHIGLQPQSVVKDGGYKVKGKGGKGLEKLLHDAHEVEKAGAFSIVIEGTIENTASEITKSVNIPTIGIGASPNCDGQILVTDDMLGLITDHTPKFVKQYATLAKTIETAAHAYASDVRTRTFPENQHTYKEKKSA